MNAAKPQHTIFGGASGANVESENHLPSRRTPDVNPIRAVVEECRQRGDDVGRDSLDTTACEETMRALELDASARARVVSRPPSEQTSRLDKALEEELSALRMIREKEHERLANANAILRKREDALAALPPMPEYPKASPRFRWTAVVGITLSLAPTVHDLLPGVFELLRWLLAIGFAAAISIMIAYAILPDDPNMEGRAK